jgi:hypothetical protein
MNFKDSDLSQDLLSLPFFLWYNNLKNRTSLKTKPTLKKIKDGKKIAMKKKNYY